MYAALPLFQVFTWAEVADELGVHQVTAVLTTEVLPRFWRSALSCG